MRLGILICGLMLVPAFAVIMEWRFQWQQKPEIELEARKIFERAGLPNVVLTLDHFRAELKGICLDPAGRALAVELLKRLTVPLRIDGDSNQIRIPAKVTGQFEGQSLRLSGWMDGPESLAELANLAKQFRPEVEVHPEAVELTPYAVLGPPASIDGIVTNAAFAGFLETIRPTTTLSVIPENGFLRVSGCLPSNRQRLGVIEAVQASSYQWPVEASRLVANPHAQATIFTKGSELAAFLRSYYDTSSPGSFVIDARNGPRLKSIATPVMESRWRTLLLPISGAIKVQPEVTLVPTDAHMPGYKPTTLTAPEVLERLQPLLKSEVMHFDRGSAELAPLEQVKLGSLVYLIQQAGPEARFIVAGYEEPGTEPGGGNGKLRQNRADAVAQALVSLGVSKDVLLPQGFDAPRPPGVITEELRRESRRAELLVK